MTERTVGGLKDEHRSNVGGYAKVAAVLSVLTLIELGLILPDLKVWYRDNAQWLLPLVVPMLFTLTTVKFLTVVGFFMHLRQDRGGPRLVFFAPLAIALLIVLAMVLLYGRPWESVTSTASGPVYEDRLEGRIS
jgi:caa(3)-type oxidase subunit IV